MCGLLLSGTLQSIILLEFCLLKVVITCIRKCIGFARGPVILCKRNVSTGCIQFWHCVEQMLFLF